MLSSRLPLFNWFITAVNCSTNYRRSLSPFPLCRIAEIENKIGAGLIEEVIQVAEGELKLVDAMTQSKV
jgi:hypothetical protein